MGRAAPIQSKIDAHEEAAEFLLNESRRLVHYAIHHAKMSAWLKSKAEKDTTRMAALKADIRDNSFEAAKFERGDGLALTGISIKHGMASSYLATSLYRLRGSSTLDVKR